MRIGNGIPNPAPTRTILMPPGGIFICAPVTPAPVEHEADRVEDGFDALVLAAGEGPFEQPYWSTFLNRIRAFTGADYASLTFHRPDAAPKDTHIIRSADANFAVGEEDVRDVVRRLSLPYATMRLNHPCSMDEVFDNKDRRNAAYLDYLHDRRFDHAFVMRMAEPGGGNCWLTLGRKRTDFHPHVRPALVRLAPHLALSMRTLVRLEQETFRASIAADAVRRLDFGWLTVDASGCVIEVDEGAERLLRRAGNTSGSVKGRSLPLPRKSLERVSGALADLVASDTDTPRAIHLLDDPWLDMLLVPVRTRAVSGGNVPIAVGYVHGVEPNRPDRCERLMVLFDLTSNEAKLALALSEGMSIAEAAHALGLKEGTARNYSKRIYAKTDTRGQADLVRIILASVIAMH